MNVNPWQVDSIQEFYFLKCPECNFTNKEEIDFKAHAIKNHPLSIPFFETFDFTIEENGTFEGCDKENESTDTFITIKEEVLPMRNDYENSEKEFKTENYVNLIKKEEENDPLTMGNSIIKSEKEFLNLETVVNFETPCKKSLDISNVKSHKCSICIRSFRSFKRLSKHRAAEHEGEEPFKCHICDARFFKKITMNRHLTSVHEGMKPFKCSRCDSSFSSNADMNRHIDSVHEGNKPYTCSFCGVKLAQKSYLKTHIETVHEGKKPYECPTCDFSTAGKVTLKNHISAIHEKKKPYQCSVCGTSFTTRVNLGRHIASVHERKQEYQCPKCDLRFSLSSNLKRHVAVVHEGIKNFQCPVCGNCFALKKTMQTHIATVHEGKKPFKCEMCDSSFSQRGQLKRHIATVHEGQKPFKCSICDSSFTQSRSLKRHIAAVHERNMDTHINSDHEEKEQNNEIKENAVQEPMECNLCAITLKHASNYIKHYQTEHGTLPPEYADKETFICDQCPGIYLSKSILKSHIRKRHMKTEYNMKRDKIRNCENGMEYVDAFKCSSCKKVFSAGNIYIQHFQKIHGGLPPEYEDKEKFICDECPNIFLEKHRLNTHKSWVHSNRPKKKHKVVKCKFCSKKYSQNRVLQEHIFREHEKTTVFQCEQCTRNYGTKTQLKAHIHLVHERVKCSECGQEICNSFMLKRHKAKVHGIIPENAHHCKLCPLFFSSKGSLNNHISKIHPEIKE